MNTLPPTSVFNPQIPTLSIPTQNRPIKHSKTQLVFPCRTRRSFRSIHANSEKQGNGAVAGSELEDGKELNRVVGPPPPPLAPPAPVIQKDLKKVVNKTAATFAPRASTASKNPAVPGSTLYTVFEVQAYISMLLGGALSFNLIFPSNVPDIWRLMGMWSIWMFTIPSLRARDCSSKEKEALNYLFLVVPLINVIIPFFWKSFAVVWSADTVAFFAMYTWKSSNSPENEEVYPDPQAQEDVSRLYKYI
ncbi:hypothetical protein V2J09_021220 [Rumex salicifolius]